MAQPKRSSTSHHPQSENRKVPMMKVKARIDYKHLAATGEKKAKDNKPKVNTIPKTTPKTIQKATVKKNPKAKVKKRDCTICMEGRDPQKFPAKEESVCKHMADVCKECIGNWLKVRIQDNDFADAHIECSECEATFGYGQIKQLEIVEAVFASWDEGLARQYLRASPVYVACLNSKCGLHFAIDGCKNKRKLECPYCKQSVCAKCSRPWHGAGGCRNAILAEEKAAAEMVAKLSKPCPACGRSIEKNGGCDHMTCSCGHHFCYECLGPIRPRGDQHRPDCRNAVRLADAPEHELLAMAGMAFGFPEEHAVPRGDIIAVAGVMPPVRPVVPFANRGAIQAMHAPHIQRP